MDLSQYGIQMWSKEKIKQFRQVLLTWYDEHKRDLPWRKTQDPYYIWVSEIMCQQTRVDTVIPYYLRFVKTFPTVEALAQASEDDLLKMWEGLGYYSRVRNMQIAARQIIEEFDGVFPNTIEDIRNLKGIGPYTAGAIASIAFGLPEPAVDGNLMRVLSRLFEIGLDVGNPSNRKVFQEVAAILIDPKRPGDFNQALMDLGADIDAPVNPRPEDSPIKAFSAAYLNGTIDRYPVKLPKKKPRPLFWRAFVVQNEKGEFLLEKNTQADLLNGFWHFPLIQDFSRQAQPLSLLTEEHKTPEEIANNEIPLAVQFQAIYKIPLQEKKKLPGEVKHIFSHQKWHITFERFQSNGTAVIPDASRQLSWVDPAEFSLLPFSKVQDKMWKHVRLYDH